METDQYRPRSDERAATLARQQNATSTAIPAVRTLLGETGDLINMCHDGMAMMEARIDGREMPPETHAPTPVHDVVLVGTLEDRLLRANELLGQLAERIRVAGSRF